MRYVYVVKKRQIMKTIKKILHNSELSEKSIEHYLVERVRKLGGECLKYSNPHAIGYPDRIVLLPGGRVMWVELKSYGERPRAIQQQRIERLRQLGQEVHVCDSRQAVDAIVGPITLNQP